MPVKGKRISVMAHAGYRGEEQPRSFFIEDRKIDVIRVNDQWIEQDAEGKNRSRCFRVEGSDGSMHLLCCYEMTGDWYLK